MADYLSCEPIATITFDVYYVQLAQEQSSCIDLLHACTLASALRIQDCTLDTALPPIACDISLGHLRPLLPTRMQ